MVYYYLWEVIVYSCIRDIFSSISQSSHKMSGFILCLLIHFKYLFINSHQLSFFYMYISKVESITIKKAVFIFVFRMCFGTNVEKNNTMKIVYTLMHCLCSFVLCVYVITSWCSMVSTHQGTRAIFSGLFYFCLSQIFREIHIFCLFIWKILSTWWRFYRVRRSFQ